MNFSINFAGERIEQWLSGRQFGAFGAGSHGRDAAQRQSSDPGEEDEVFAVARRRIDRQHERQLGGRVGSGLQSQRRIVGRVGERGRSRTGSH